MNNLTTIDLSYSRHLVQIPDFTGVPNLKELFLEGRTNWIEVHSSVTKPSETLLQSYLREFVVSGCSKLSKFEDHETASTHEPEIELISSKTPVSSHAHEMKDVEISSGAKTESVFFQIKGESQMSKLTMHVKEPIEHIRRKI